MNENIQVRDFTGSPGDWDARIAKFGGSLFHTSTWLSILASNETGKVRRLELCADDTPIGVVPVVVRRLFPLTIAASPLVVESTPQLGVVCAREHLAPAIGAVTKFLRSEGVHFVRLLQREQLAQDVHVSGCELVTKHTHVLDLQQSLDLIWTRMEGRCRTAIRKAQKSGVVVEVANSEVDLAAYHDIYSRVYLEQGMQVPVSLGLHYAIWRSLPDSSRILLVARSNSQIIAGALLIVDGHKVLYWGGGSLSTFNSLNPNSLIQWEAIKQSMDRGALRYDFVGSDIERLAKFKQSFGGSVQTYTLVEYSSAPWVRTIRRHYPLVKQRLMRLANRVNEPSSDR